LRPGILRAHAFLNSSAKAVSLVGLGKIVGIFSRIGDVPLTSRARGPAFSKWNAHFLEQQR
jgi:hypothetical protein